MPTYLCNRFLPLSVASVQAQTWQNWELLIADDCSPDDTYSIASALAEKDSRIRVITDKGGFNYSAINNLGVREEIGRAHV